MKKTYPGQGLSEYSLIAALVGIAICVSLVPLGQSIADLFSNILGGSSKPSTVMLANNKNLSDQIAASSLEKSISSISSGTKNALSNSSTENNNTSNETTQTVGANGTSEQVYANANKILQIANQLKQEGADPGLIDLITRMANVGHSVGDSLTNLDHMGTTGLGSMTLDEMNAATSSFETIRSELNDYLQAQPNLISATQWSTINLHADNISASPDVWAESKRFESGSGVVSSSSTVSQTVHQSSNTICNNGGNTSNCSR